MWTGSEVRVKDQATQLCASGAISSCRQQTNALTLDLGDREGIRIAEIFLFLFMVSVVVHIPEKSQH